MASGWGIELRDNVIVQGEASGVVRRDLTGRWNGSRHRCRIRPLIADNLRME
ncbi:TPA: hypothetical protein PXP51_003307 [Yersinia enterocolitica]|nr:hypothetical protein [Yersinia enterocolitica]